MRYLLIILILTGLKSWGITDAPKLLRSCINFDDSTVTVSWTPPADACGSFTHYCLYSNVDNGPYQRIATIPVLAVSNYPHKLPDLNTNRKYYITVHALCNGMDSATSDTLSIDVTYPANIGIDSVSYDMATQNIIAGWRKNPSTDTRGYQIYDFSSGNGDSIGFTSDTNYIVSTNPNNVFPVVIASLDSCNLSSILSTPHRVMRLNGAIDTCLRTIDLSWSLYFGWQSIDSQHVMLSTNAGRYTATVRLSGSATSTSIPGIVLGDTFCFLIRAFTSAGTITSSSNIVCFETRELKAPSFSYLSQVTVAQDQNIHLEWETDELHDQDRFEVLRSEDLVNFTSIASISITNPQTLNYQHDDLGVDVHNKTYQYHISTLNKCNEQTAQSNTSNSILLMFNGPLFNNHNPYTFFDGGVIEYHLEKEDPSSSTWNTLRVQATPFNAIDFSDSIGCYRVRAIEGINQYGYQKFSLSNTACIGNLLTFYFPNAINTSSANNRFLIYGNGINHDRSQYQIYNRWGELLATRRTDEAWNADYKGELVPPGVYLCILTLYGDGGEKEFIKQEIYVLR